ncbi:MAG: PCI domain-containing protein [Promethearchaeota archaeon]
MASLKKSVWVAVAVAEVVSFFTFFIFLVISVVTGLRYEIYDVVDYLTTPQFITMVVSGLVFLLLPYIAVFLQLQVEKVDKTVREKRFAGVVLNLISEKGQLNLQNTCAKYNLDEPFVRGLLEDMVERGEVAGRVDRGVFYLKDGFQILPEKERRVKSLERNLVKFISPYKFVGLAKIGKNFKLPTSVVEKVVHKMILDGKVHGFLDGNVLVRDASALALDLADLPECPFCGGKVLEDSRYCSTCGKEIEGLVEMKDDITLGEDFLEGLRD